MGADLEAGCNFKIVLLLLPNGVRVLRERRLPGSGARRRDRFVAHSGTDLPSFDLMPNISKPSCNRCFICRLPI
jgi:hypothetical protein